MASTLVQHKVKDFAEWKKVFDSEAKFLSAGGVVGAPQIFRDASDPNSVSIIQKCSSMELAHKMIESAELKSKMDNAGVLGKPTFTFMNEA